MGEFLDYKGTIEGCIWIWNFMVIQGNWNLPQRMYHVISNLLNEALNLIPYYEMKPYVYICKSLWGTLIFLIHSSGKKMVLNLFTFMSVNSWLLFIKKVLSQQIIIRISKWMPSWSQEISHEWGGCQNWK
jgi:hypothetical protein